MGIFLTILEC